MTRPCVPSNHSSTEAAPESFPHRWATHEVHGIDSSSCLMQIAPMIYELYLGTKARLTGLPLISHRLAAEEVVKVEWAMFEWAYIYHVCATLSR